eukprot:3453681-Amphidinium_carterae.1
MASVGVLICVARALWRRIHCCLPKFPAGLDAQTLLRGQQCSVFPSLLATRGIAGSQLGRIRTPARQNSLVVERGSLAPLIL